MAFKKREIILLRVAFTVIAFVLSFLYIVFSWKLFTWSVSFLINQGVLGLIIVVVLFFLIPILGITKVRYYIEKISDRGAVYILLATTKKDEYERVVNAIQEALRSQKENEVAND